MTLEDSYKALLGKFETSIVELVKNAHSELYCEHLPYLETDTDGNANAKAQKAIINMLAGNIEWNGSTAKIYGVDEADIHVSISINEYDRLRDNLISTMSPCPKDMKIKALEKQIKELNESFYRSLSR